MNQTIDEVLTNNTDYLRKLFTTKWNWQPSFQFSKVKNTITGLSDYSILKTALHGKQTECTRFLKLMFLTFSEFSYSEELLTIFIWQNMTCHAIKNCNLVYIKVKIIIQLFLYIFYNPVEKMTKYTLIWWLTLI